MNVCTVTRVATGFRAGLRMFKIHVDVDTTTKVHNYLITAKILQKYWSILSCKKLQSSRAKWLTTAAA